MRLGRAIWGLRIGLGLLVAGALLVPAVGMRVGMAVLVGAVLLELFCERWLERRAWRRHHAAVDRFDYAEAERILNELRAFAAGRPGALEVIDLHQAVLDSLRGRWAAARTLCEKLLESERFASQRAVLENNLAWALMHLGLTGRALELSRRALAEGEARQVPHVGFYRGTHAIGLFLAGRASEALPLLERVIAEHARDGAHAQAARAFYLGEALTELGRGAEARAAYERAVREAPPSMWADRARAKLG